jgi:hypothetical protein
MVANVSEEPAVPHLYKRRKGTEELSTLKMKVVGSLETCHATRRHIPEDINLESNCTLQ